MILGVCEWLAGKVGIEVKIMRLLFVVAALCAGFGVLGYLILWVVKQIVD